jgi:hypothetical protein
MEEGRQRLEAALTQNEARAAHMLE